MIIEFFNTPAAAVKAAKKYNRTVAALIYRTIGIDSDKAILDSATLTGYHLSPNGIIHKDRKDGSITWTLVIHSGISTILERTERIPAYALPYLINSDSSGLEAEDIKQIDQWANNYYARLEPGESIIINPYDEEPHFTWKPAFGLACDVITCDILILASRVLSPAELEAHRQKG